MADGAVNFYLDATDDPLLPDQIPAFDGGMFSNLRANLLQPNQSKVLGNFDIDKLGKGRSRRGTILLGLPPPAPGSPSGTINTIIQGLTSYQTPTANYIVAANDGKMYKFVNGVPGTWERIALGGTKDKEAVLICREGQIDNANDPTTGVSYTIGETVIKVSDFPAATAPIFAPGEKLYFVNNRRSDPWEYTIASWAPGGPEITLEEPGLVFDVKDNWKFIVTRPATVTADVAAGLKTIPIVMDNGGEAFLDEKFVIVSENVTHTVSAHTTTSLTWTAGAGLIGNWTASGDPARVVFAQGNDSLFFCDGVHDIYGWNGKVLMNIGSHSVLDELQGTTFSRAATDPPTACKILLWFQNRLIASGITAEPDAIYFSDYFDPTSWDNNYQKVRIGGGESDPITGLTAWTDYNLIVWKKNSIYVINLDPSQNPNPDDPTLLVASFSVKQLHKLIGCPAPNTAVQVGGGSTTPGSDIFFMDGDKKVHSIRRVMAAETQQEVGQAVSLPIQDVLDTTNLDYIDTSCAFYHNEHYVLGFPSTRGADGGIRPNATAAYNLLTQSWCGVWTWAPTCFSRRTDLGSYSKLIFGDWRNIGGTGFTGRVLQWLDDQSLDDETTESYQDFGHNLKTSITTRAITFGDFYSYKTGLSVEFEFDESTAEEVLVKVILDKVPHRWPIAYSSTNPTGTFSSLSEPRIRVGPNLRIPFTLPASPDMLRKAFDLQRYGTWRELQFAITSTSGKLAIRSIRVTGFMDTIRLQTIPMEGIPELGVNPLASSGGP